MDPGESITLYMVNPSELGFWSESGTQTVHVIYGGTGASLSLYTPLY
jgi:hypothetical protein